ncbi:MAG: PKD domain-containing protein, partial [Chitinophagales bacterium]
MSKKVILLLLFTACNLFLFNNYVFNNAVQAPAGYTNAPGDNGGCKTSGCHVGATEFTGGNATDINFGFFSGSHTAYTKNDNYIFQINFNGSSAQNNYGWQVTALDASGNAIGTLGTQNQSTVALSSQGGRDYVGHFNHSGTGAYIFNWVAPSNYLQGTATFYIAAVSNGGLGERVYYKTFTFDPDSTIVAPSLSADFTVDDTIPCLGETINFTQQSTGNPVGYSWDFGAGATPQTSTDPNPSVVYSSAGLKSVGLTITDSNGDTDRENKINFINVNPGPNADAGSDVVVCSGGTVQLQASGGVAYQWSPSTGLSNANVPNPIAAPSDSTVYSVEVTDSLGCTNSDEVLVAVVNAPVLSLNDTSVCPGDSVVLDAGNPGFDYDWSTGSTDQSIKIGQAGTYSVTVSSGGVCAASDTVVIMHLSAPIADAG